MRTIWRRVLVLLVVAIALAAAPPSWCALVQIDEHTWGDDFEGGTLEGWSLPEYYRPAELDGEGVLEVGGGEGGTEAVRLAYPGVGPELSDYAVQCRVRHAGGSWAGLYFRASAGRHFEAFIFGARMLIRRQPGAVILSQAPLPPSDDPWRTLRIVGLGPSVRVYVDGEQVFGYSDEELLSGRCGIASHNVHAYYDDFLICTKLRPEETLLAAPEAPEEGLVLPPGRPARVTLSVWNAAAQARAIELAWTLDEGETRRQSLTLQPNQRRRLPIEVGALAEGLHWIQTAFVEGGTQVMGGQFPLAAVVPPDAQYEDPFLPWGVYDKYQLGGDTWALNTYLHAMCNDLRNHGFNTIMAGSAMPDPGVLQLDILARYGVKVILRAAGLLPPEVTAHRAVLAIAYGDEPSIDDLDGYRARFEELAAQYGKPITTCLVGDSAGTGAGDDPWLIWPGLGSGLKMARYYPIRKSFYDLVRYPAYKGGYPPRAVFRLLEVAAGAEGWYYVMQGFGGVVSEASPEPYWRNPDGAEMRGMAHLALAHGARGIIVYPYQQERPDWPALVDQRWQRPIDDKYEALASVARSVQPLRETLLSSTWAGIEIRPTPHTVEAVGRMTRDGRRLAYLVNLDTDAAVEATVVVMDPIIDNRPAAPASFRELFSGADIPFERERDRSILRLNMEPGGGALVEIAM
ncbi:MAG: hypothetical protein AB7Y46_07640 [Armatimonadota bacterium]